MQWRKIYKQVSSNETYKDYIGDYAYTNGRELFAEATMYYYHDPDKLKMVDIDVPGYDNLYDYMDHVMNESVNK